MSEKKTPAFLFYPKDFYMDTVTWHPAEVGVHIRLMCIQFENGPMGQNEFNDLVQPLIDLGLDPNRIRSKYKINDLGQYFNEKLENVISKREEYLYKQRLNGEKGGRPKNPIKSQPATQNKPKENPEIDPNNNPTHNPNESTRVENENKYLSTLKEVNTSTLKDIGQNNLVSDSELEEPVTQNAFFYKYDKTDMSHPFNVFWNEYPRRVKKQDAIRKFKTHVKDWDTLKAIIVDIQTRFKMEIWDKGQMQYIPHPTTYLNNLQWEDELVPLKTNKPALKKDGGLNHNPKVIHTLPEYSKDDSIDEDVDELRKKLKEQLGSKS